MNTPLIRNSFFLLLLLGLLHACSGGEKKSGSETPKEVDYSPVIVFRNLILHDTITVGDTVDYGFTYFNDGRANLELTEVYSDWNECPPVFSKDPVPPGGEGKITVKCAITTPGQTNIRVMVKANTNQPEIVLVIFCRVEEKK